MFNRTRTRTPTSLPKSPKMQMQLMVGRTIIVIFPSNDYRLDGKWAYKQTKKKKLCRIKLTSSVKKGNLQATGSGDIQNLQRLSKTSLALS